MKDILGYMYIDSIKYYNFQFCGRHIEKLEDDGLIRMMTFRSPAMSPEHTS